MIDRRQLALRIGRIADDAYEAARDNPDVNEALRAPLLAVADFVVRQIEWTHVCSKWASPETFTWDIEVREDGEPDFTLFPEGWNPHETT